MSDRNPPSITHSPLLLLLGSLMLGCSLQDFDSLRNESLLLGSGGDAGQTGDIGRDAGWNFQSGAAGGAGGSAGSAGSGLGGSSETDAGALEGNLFEDPSFELGTSGWLGFGSSQVTLATDVARTGTRSLSSINRSNSWEGPTTRVDVLTEPGNLYVVSAWLRVVGDSQPIGMSLKTVCVETGEAYTQLVTALPVGEDWTLLQGLLTLPECELTEASIYFEGPAPGESFYLDDVRLELDG